MSTSADNLGGFAARIRACFTGLIRALLRHDRLLVGSESKFRALLESAPSAMLIIDSHGRIGLVNSCAEELFGLPRSSLQGTRLKALIRSDLQPGFHEGLKQYLRSPGPTRMGREGTLIAQRDDGTDFPIELSLSPLKTDSGLLISAAVRDMSEQLHNEERLTYLAEHDPLTGLENRRSFETRLETEVKRAAQDKHCSGLILLDIDGLKDVNDTLGHSQGDELIRTIASLVGSRVRKTDHVARIGGDEFAVLLPDTELPAAAAVAEDLLETIRTHGLLLGSQRVRPSVCAGVASIDASCRDGEDPMVSADLALYSAKEHGRDRADIFVPEPGTPRRTGQARTAWSLRVRSGLDENLFVPYRQPILDMSDRTIRRYELLARLLADDGSVVNPGAFMPAAERSGMIRELDRRMASWAIDLISHAERSGERIAYEVNLSGRSFDDPGLAPLIAKRVDESGIDPSLLAFEITETAAMANMDETRRCANALREVGCRFALDDFGAGFASFLYLKHIPLDGLKIDGEFISGMATSAVDRMLVSHMAEIGHDLNLFTIAEFVEDEETLEILDALEIDAAQGFHVGHPEPVEHIIDLYPERTTGPLIRA